MKKGQQVFLTVAEVLEKGADGIIPDLGEFIANHTGRHSGVKTFVMVRTKMDNLDIAPSERYDGKKGAVLLKFRFSPEGLTANKWRELASELLDALDSEEN